MHVIIQDPKANEVNYVCAFVHVLFFNSDALYRRKRDLMLDLKPSLL